MFRDTNFEILIREGDGFYGFNWCGLDNFCSFANQNQ